MITIEKSAGQDLKDFEKMIEEIKPYLPKPRGIVNPEPQLYQLSENIRRVFRY